MNFAASVVGWALLLPLWQSSSRRGRVRREEGEEEEEEEEERMVLLSSETVASVLRGLATAAELYAS